ncbi:uncharacterized protein [Eurosta solidaginis]|uniref:uncharacterized protein n=1 Tax=Eurosta solidaginis TaxID=178769 RepID=UPI003530CB40
MVISSTSVLDVSRIRGPSIDSDHNLVADKIRTPLNAAKTKEQKTQGKLDVEKLQSQQTANDFTTRLSHLLSESTTHPEGIQEQWEHISKALRTAAEKKIGHRRPRNCNWYDEECRVATERKDAAYKATLKASATRGVCEHYRELKKEARRLFRKKKAEAERRECKELELLATRNNARKFYQKIRRQTEGFKTGANSCRNENGDLVTDVQRVLRFWREHFSVLLNGGSNSPRRDEEPDPAIDDDGIYVPPSDYDEVRIAITRLKNNKTVGADGLPAELFKCGGEELVRRMQQLLSKIWAEEYMPDGWNLSNSHLP